MTAKLSTYRAKRDPQKTPEPMGARPSVSRKQSLPTFVIQEHHARALHWDFRLEHDGVLVSWALPKGLPIDPKSNHLAVHTEDHPIEYGTFAGDIPKGEYGGGHVSIWDHGTYELEKWTPKEVMVVLHGNQAKGRYVLFPTTGKNWMIHRMDPAPLGFEPMPDQIKPMLAQPGAVPKSDKDWSYEFKWDGVRAIVYIEGGRVRALSRNDKDLVASFPELRDLGQFFGARSAILDGEIVAFDDQGRSSFGKLQQRLHFAPNRSSRSSQDKKEFAANFLAFDLLYYEGHSLLHLSYDDRRHLLDSLDLNGERFATPPSVFDVKGSELLSISRDQGFEGLVIKRRDSVYSPGQRNGSWIKVKNFRTQEVIIGGWTDGKGERQGSLGALLLGIPADTGLVYVGKVGTGFDAKAREQILAALRPLARKTSPFTGELSNAESAIAHFVRPKLVGEVQYSEFTRDGHLRHPSWRGMRPDKSPNEVIREP